MSSTTPEQALITDQQRTDEELKLMERLGRSVSIDQAAALLNLSRRSIYTRIRDGRLATIRSKAGSQRVLVQSLFDQGFRPQACPTSASAATFDAIPVIR